MTRDEFERTVWRNAPGLNSRSSHQRSLAVQAVLEAADEYAASAFAPDDPQRAAQRRDALLMTVREARDQCRAVHLDDPGASGHSRPACRVVTAAPAAVTADPAAVTCHSCMRTAAYGSARLGVAS